MQILTTQGTTAYDHDTRTVTRIANSRGHQIDLTAQLPKTYQDHDPLELLNAIANLHSEDFTALSDFQARKK